MWLREDVPGAGGIVLQLAAQPHRHAPYQPASPARSGLPPAGAATGGSAPASVDGQLAERRVLRGPQLHGLPGQHHPPLPIVDFVACTGAPCRRSGMEVSPEAGAGRGSAITAAKNSARRESGPRRPARDGVVMADLLQKAHNSRQRRHFDGAAPSSSGGHVDGLPASSPAYRFRPTGRVSSLPTPPPKWPPSGMTPRSQDGRFLMRPGYCPPRFECCVAAGLPPPLNSWEGGDDWSTNCGLPWGTVPKPTGTATARASTTPGL